jgi:hypothetical protein
MIDDYRFSHLRYRTSYVILVMHDNITVPGTDLDRNIVNRSNIP